MGAPGSGELTHQQIVFCLEYLKDENGTRAAIEAGYAKKSAAAQASDLLSRPKIQAEIKRRSERVLQKIEVRVEDVVREYARIAFLDLKGAYDESGKLLHPKDMTEDVRRAISSVDVLEEFEGTGREREQIGFTKKLRTWDKIKALEALGRYTNMFTPENDPDRAKAATVNVTVNLDLLSHDEKVQYRDLCAKLAGRSAGGVPSN